MGEGNFGSRVLRISFALELAIFFNTLSTLSVAPGSLNWPRIATAVKSAKSSRGRHCQLQSRRMSKVSQLTSERLKQQFPLLITTLLFTLAITTKLFSRNSSSVERFDVGAIHGQSLVAVGNYILRPVKVRIASRSIAVKDG